MTTVADSSYLVQGLLKDAALFESDDIIISPDLALYEVINAIWKHEVVLKDIKDGSRHVAILSELESSGRLRFVRPDRQVIDKAYQLALRKKCALYDSVFVALASDLGLELKTFDVAQKGLSNGDTVNSSSD